MKVVGIGGGHGLAATLRAALNYADDIAAVVTVADNGGSSGRLSRDLGIPPPGDIRNCLVALSPESGLVDVFQHRFRSGALTGHTVGNLIIAGLTEKLGDFAAAVAASADLLRSKGAVYPATTELVRLNARVNGGVVSGQVAVAQTRPPIQAVYLEPSDPTAHGPAVQAILDADQVVLGPGSLFTSLIATLLVPDIRSALLTTHAHRVFVCNARMQKGETEGLTASAHVEAVLAHTGPDAIDAVILQTPSRAEGVEIDQDALGFSGTRIVEADVADAVGAHDPMKLGAVLATVGRRGFGEESRQ